MKVLITGGAGYIGSHIANKLHSLGHEVHVIDNLSYGIKQSLSSGIRFYEVDILDKNRLHSLMSSLSLDQVIHCAALTDTAASISKADQYFQVNLVGTENVLEGCILSKTPRFLFSSSASVYGNALGHVKESEAGNPIHPYGQSKWLAEIATRKIAEQNSQFRYGVLRYFNVAGTSFNRTTPLRFPPCTLFSKLNDALTHKTSAFIVNGQNYSTPDGTCVRDYIHMEDLVDIHLTGIDYLKEFGSFTLNCGSGTGSSVLEVAHAFQALSSSPLQIHFGPRRPKDPAMVIADIQQLKQTLTWTPRQRSLSELCRSSLEGYKIIHPLNN